MKSSRVLCLVLLLALVAGSVPAAGAGEGPNLADLQVQRLAGLCRLWGTVKYFHPLSPTSPSIGTSPWSRPSQK